ncbi:MAG: DNA polymerase III subunit delta' [Anaerolineae bacterium]
MAWSVVGHEWAVELLQKSIREGRVSHAYLFTGPPQVGRRTLALNFAQALNCLEEGERPCGKCLSCRKIATGNHPDVRLIEGEGGRIKIEQVRQMQRELSLSLHEGRWKVYILPDMEGATLEAANCLLKTLEEPPAQTVLLLTATGTEKLLPTIVSRCQVLSLRVLSVEAVERMLEGRGVDSESAALLARLSGGKPGWALNALQDETILERRRSYLEELVRLLGQNRTARMATAYKLSQGEPSEALTLLLGWWRDLLMLKSGCASQITNIDYKSLLQAQAESLTIGQIRDFIRRLQDALRQLEENVNPRLALEVLMLHLPS